MNDPHSTPTKINHRFREVYRLVGLYGLSKVSATEHPQSAEFKQCTVDFKIDGPGRQKFFDSSVRSGSDLYFEELTRPYEELEPDDRGYDDGVRDTIDRRAAGQLALCFLPRLEIARCPFCNTSIQIPFDGSSLDSFAWHEAIEPDTECIHLRCINLAANQRQAGPNRLRPRPNLPEVPFLIPAFRFSLRYQAVIREIQLESGDVVYITTTFHPEPMGPRLRRHADRWLNNDWLPMNWSKAPLNHTRRTEWIDWFRDLALDKPAHWWGAPEVFNLLGLPGWVDIQDWGNDYRSERIHPALADAYFCPIWDFRPYVERGQLSWYADGQGSANLLQSHVADDCPLVGLEGSRAFTRQIDAQQRANHYGAERSESSFALGLNEPYLFGTVSQLEQITIEETVTKDAVTFFQEADKLLDVDAFDSFRSLWSAFTDGVQIFGKLGEYYSMSDLEARRQSESDPRFHWYLQWIKDGAPFESTLCLEEQNAFAQDVYGAIRFFLDESLVQPTERGAWRRVNLSVINEDTSVEELDALSEAERAALRKVGVLYCAFYGSSGGHMNLRPEPTHLRERCDWLLNVRVYLGELLLDPGLMKSPTYQLIRIELQELDTMMAMAARRYCWDFGTPLFDCKPEEVFASDSPSAVDFFGLWWTPKSTPLVERALTFTNRDLQTLIPGYSPAHGLKDLVGLYKDFVNFMDLVLSGQFVESSSSSPELMKHRSEVVSKWQASRSHRSRLCSDARSVFNGDWMGSGLFDEPIRIGFDPSKGPIVSEQLRHEEKVSLRWRDEVYNVFTLKVGVCPICNADVLARQELSLSSPGLKPVQACEHFGGLYAHAERLKDFSVYPFSNNSFYGITGEAIAFVVASALKESGEIVERHGDILCLFSQRSAALIDDFHALVTRETLGLASRRPTHLIQSILPRNLRVGHLAGHRCLVRFTE